MPQTTGVGSPALANEVECHPRQTVFQIGQGREKEHGYILYSLDTLYVPSPGNGSALF